MALPLQGHGMLCQSLLLRLHFSCPPPFPFRKSRAIAYPFPMRYILGFDGGGSKTECVLMNSVDQVLARTYAGPSNPWRIGIELAARAVEDAASLALEDAGLSRASK